MRYKSRFYYYIIYFCITVFKLIHFTNGLFEQGDEQIYLQPGENRTITSPNFPYFTYKPGTSARYIFSTANGFQLQVQCNINIPKPSSSSCTSEIFYIATDYSLNLLGSEYFCGVGNLSRQSLFSHLIVAYTSSSTTLGGFFSCTITATSSLGACDCGWTKNAKIIGGTEPEINELISMVGLIHRPSLTLFCGGSIISYRYILSAAHCFDSINNPTDIIARLGDHNLQNPTESIYTLDMNIRRVRQHEGYNRQNQANDIALLTTERDIIYTKGVGPACLPLLYDRSFFDNKMLWAAGWGSTFFGGPLSPVLRQVGLNVISQRQCQQSIRNLVDSQICTFTSGKDTCQFDSGGALYYRTSRLFASAIISFGTGCAGTLPSVNTRINDFLYWIQINTPGAQYCSLVF